MKGAPTNLLVAHRLDGIDSLEREIDRAEKALDHIIGRAEIDNRGIGVVRMFLERSRESLKRIRESIARDGTSAEPAAEGS